jgi:hypothetical protein
LGLRFPCALKALVCALGRFSRLIRLIFRFAPVPWSSPAYERSIIAQYRAGVSPVAAVPFLYRRTTEGSSRPAPALQPGVLVSERCGSFQWWTQGDSSSRAGSQQQLFFLFIRFLVPPFGSLWFLE